MEVFNVLFIREQEKRHVVHCMACARKQSPQLQGIVCLEEYRLSELYQIYDAFILHKLQSSSGSLSENSTVVSCMTSTSMTTSSSALTTTSNTTSTTSPLFSTFTSSTSSPILATTVTVISASDENPSSTH